MKHINFVILLFFKHIWFIFHQNMMSKVIWYTKQKTLSFLWKEKMFYYQSKPIAGNFYYYVFLFSKGKDTATSWNSCLSIEMCAQAHFNANRLNIANCCQNKSPSKTNFVSLIQLPWRLRLSSKIENLANHCIFSVFLWNTDLIITISNNKNVVVTDARWSFS